MKTTAKRIRAFLQQYIGAREFGDRDNIFMMGLVNSLFAMQLISWVEKEFQLRVEDADLDITNFNSVGAIRKFIKRKHLESVSPVVPPVPRPSGNEEEEWHPNSAPSK